MLKLASEFVPGFRVNGCLPAVRGSMLLTIVDYISPRGDVTEAPDACPGSPAPRRTDESTCVTDGAITYPGVLPGSVWAMHSDKKPTQ